MAIHTSIPAPTMSLSHIRSALPRVRLPPQERAELRRREQLEEEAAAARRNKVFVTLDLLGRKVLTAEGPSASAAGDNGYNSSIGAAFQIGAAADPAPQSPSVDGSSSSKRGGPGAAAGVGKVDVSGAVGSDSQKVCPALIEQQAYSHVAYSHVLGSLCCC